MLMMLQEMQSNRQIQSRCHPYFWFCHFKASSIKTIRVNDLFGEEININFIDAIDVRDGFLFVSFISFHQDEMEHRFHLSLCTISVNRIQTHITPTRTQNV